MYSHLVFIVLIFITLPSVAQEKNDVRLYMPTENLAINTDANTRSNRPKRKKISYIYVPDAHGILYGNVCATEETHKMGFEYLVEPQRDGSKTWMGKRLNNLGVKSRLFFTRSPFWKVTLKNRIKKCGKMTGDIVG